MSSVTLGVEHTKSRFPFKIVGLVLLGFSLLGFIYAFYPPRTNAVEIDVGSELQVLSSPESAAKLPGPSSTHYERPPVFVETSWNATAQPTPTPFSCEIRGVPSSLPEGRTTLSLTYFCNRKQINPARFRPNWTTSAGRIDLKNPSTLEIDTSGLGGQRLILNAAFMGCGRIACQKKWTIAVLPRNRIVVRVVDDAGNPVPGAVVTLNQATRQRTDARGAAQFLDLEPGAYSISVVAAGFNEFTTTLRLTTRAALVRAPLVRIQTASPSPTVSPSPTPSISPSPTPTISPSPGPSASVSPEASPTGTDTLSESSFAPGRNGSLTVSWPISISSGWSNVCRIRYVPPTGVAEQNVEAAFFLTSITGLANTEMRSGFQPLDQTPREWNIPLEPAGVDGSVVRAQLTMTVRIDSESNTSEIQLQTLQSTIDEQPLTRNQTLGGSTLSGLFGAGFLGVGSIKRKDKETRRTRTRSEISDLVKHLPPGSTVTLSDTPRSAGAVPSVLVWFADKVLGMKKDALRGARTIEIPLTEVEQPKEGELPPAPPLPGTTSELESTPPAEPPRYVDVTIYEKHLFGADDLEGAAKVPDDVPLIAKERYTLGVAIRLKRTGVQSEQEAGREVENPREAEETLTIHVLATPVYGFKIKERLFTILWPFNADSNSALFRLEVEEPTGSSRPGSIEIRVLDDSLNLLDVVKLKVGIVAEQGDELDPAVPLRDLTWPDKKGEGLSLAGSSEARLASITVQKVTGGFTFDFIIHSARGEAVHILIFRDISTDDLRSLLTKVRDFWTKLVISNYAKKLAVSPSTYEAYLSDLRELGIQAWSLLFDTRTFAKQGASERLGQILARVEADEQALKEALPLFDSGEGDRIQISYAEETNFIFPWSILHPPVPKNTPVDPLRFWGARYQIEQVTEGPKKDHIDTRPINVLFALDSTFGDAPSQKKMFEDYQAAAGGQLLVSAPVSDRDTLHELLISAPAAHLAYFYCHGYAATTPGLLMADGVKALRTLIEDIRAKSAEADPSTASAFEKLVELTSKMAGDAWIYLGDSQVTDQELSRMQFFAARRPIVFLNMCQSADLVPSMSSGLVNVFLDHNASAVVGTESPMTGVFADAFARKVFDRLFRGDNIGTALWKARRHFLTQGRNPLGLAYTLYGRADATLGTKDQPSIISTS